jgi:hypothetical protein
MAVFNYLPPAFLVERGFAGIIINRRKIKVAQGRGLMA